MQAAADPQAMASLEDEMRALRDALLAAEERHAATIAGVHRAHRRSAANLVHYVELRRHDVRDLQARLGALGLSSLGRSEAHVLATIEAILSVLTQLNGRAPEPSRARVALSEGSRVLAANADRLLGSKPPARSTRIMVTLPTEAAGDTDLVGRMAAAGMDLARVNCAHDDRATWERMIANVRGAARSNGRAPRVAMDLGGPKVRTGPLEPGPKVLRITPRRDRLGAVVEPARVWLSGGRLDPLDPSTVVVPVDDRRWLARREVGDVVTLVDSREAKRRWEIVETSPDGCLAAVSRTTYVVPGTKLVCRARTDEDVATVADLAPVEQAHRVAWGDQIVLTRSLVPATPTAAGEVHRIGCTLDAVFGAVRPGQRVWLDDGKIGATVERADGDEIAAVVTDVKPGGTNLRAGKGINFPETHLEPGALTDQDLRDLDVAACGADIVSLSFVRHPTDVERLQAELAARDAGECGIVLKIENAAAFEHLPQLLLTLLRSRTIGVMIARGDLAVEVGFDRLAEVQEEIMWACEAAHVPVIWATQVLDTLARTGQPSRAEVTDAATAVRAECVMLNKGPHIVEAIHALDSILTRMQHHQQKKRSLLRRLRAWDAPAQAPAPSASSG